MASILFSAKVLQILTEETTPSADLIATVKHLYETKLKVLFLVLTTFFGFIVFLKVSSPDSHGESFFPLYFFQDAAILIPMLSSLSKDEVPFFNPPPPHLPFQ